MNIHIPQRPGWGCRCCDEPWPCGPARVGLRREHGEEPTSVILYVAAQHAAAAVDMPDLPAGILHARFFGWLHGPGTAGG